MKLTLKFDTISIHYKSITLIDFIIKYQEIYSEFGNKVNGKINERERMFRLDRMKKDPR